VNLNVLPLLQFQGNQVYGATPNGLAYWWVDQIDVNPQSGPGSVIKDFTVWNQYQWGVFGYESNKVTLDGFTILGDAAIMASGNGAIGLHFSDYQQTNLTVTNADIENMTTGIEAPVKTGGTTFTVMNSYLANQVDIDVATIWDRLTTSDWLQKRTTVINNVRFGAAADGSMTTINMDFVPSWELSWLAANLIVSDQVFVYNYNGVTGDNFQVFYTQQAANYVVPQTQYNSDGSIRVDASPVAGLTNQQTWDLYGIAIAGEVAPSTATTQNGINGLVSPI
jgi:hypothetical protein